MSKQKSVMQHSFGTVARADMPRAQFDRSHGIKTTFDGGLLVPFLCDEIVPGDTVNCKATLFARLATPLHVPMDNMHLETFFFFVPNRLLWLKWTKFCGEQEDPGDTIDYTIPVLNGTAWATGDVADYMGLPLGLIPDNTDVNALPFRAYRFIYDEWFRDQNLQNSETFVTDDGPDSNTNVGYADVPLNRGKRHDYFTSCLPWPQKGATAVSIPLGTTAEIAAIGSAVTTDSVFVDDPDVAGNVWDFNSGVPAKLQFGATNAGTVNLVADLSTATAATINQLRQAFAIQKLLERDARGGTRYIEVIKSHFGVTSSDARLNRPEYLGGGSSPVGIQPIGQTSETATPTALRHLGKLSSVGTVLADNHGFVKSFEEHGWVIGIVNVRADLSYSQGLERMWSRSTRYDYLWPVFSHIGEQSVLNKEIWVTAADTGTINDAVFGYNGRYDEYRHKLSRITGLFAVDASSSLDAWHLSEDFASLPTLGDTFIKSAPPIDRIIAITDEPHFIMDGFISYKHTRPIPVFGTPGLIDHF